MEGLSNSPATDRELNRLTAQLVSDKLPALTVKDAVKLREKLEKRTEYIMTEVSVGWG